MTDTSPARRDEIVKLASEYERPGRLAELICDRHARDGAAALLYDTPHCTVTVTFAELAERSASLAATMAAHGVEPGSRVAVLLPRSPELVIAVLAIWRLGAVHVPLFTAFGPDAVTYRVNHAAASAFVTDAENRGKLEDTTGTVPVVICLGDGCPGDLDFATATEAPSEITQVIVDPSDPFILLYTSGTTGRPKGVPVPARAFASFHAYMTLAVDLRREDTFWNVSDPGWAYGLWYGIVGPLLLGHSTIIKSGGFDPSGALNTIERLGVTNLAGSPTFYRALRNHGAPRGFRERTHLRAASSAGEPLSPELLEWSREELGTPIHDHYGQSELGMVIGWSRHQDPAEPPRPASMGRDLPGFRAVILDAEGKPSPPGQPGDLALDTTASPLLWFTGYYQAPDKTAERFPHGTRYYVTGDTAVLHSDGTFASAVRADDVINSSGYRIGPSDIEATLHTHAAVADAAVFGTPDPYRGEAVTAAVVLAASQQASEEVIAALQEHVRDRLGKHLYPRRIIFLDELPRTPSGKLKRAQLRGMARQSSSPACVRAAAADQATTTTPARPAWPDVQIRSDGRER